MSDPEWAMSLPALLDEVWRRLEGGPSAHPTMATLGPAGPEARTVVLRAASRSGATLDVHTDAASPKVLQLQSDPRAALLFWLAEVSLQIRLRVRVEVLTGDDAAPHWSEIPDRVRVRYGGTPPGADLSDPSALIEAAEPARFAILRAHMLEVDALHLGDPHRRGLFSTDDGFAGRWIAP